MIHTVIFDMDGLMIDSEYLTFQSYLRKFDELDIHDYTLDEYKKVLGKNKAGICDLILGRYGQDFDIDTFWDDTHRYLDEALLADVPLKKGLLELLTYLKEHHFHIIAATSSDRARVDRIFQTSGLDRYIQDSVCGDEVTIGKPHPEIFLKALDKAGAKPEEALVLEDSEAGIACAHNASIPVICIPDLKEPQEEYRAMTTAVLEDLSQVIPFLEEANSKD